MFWVSEQRLVDQANTIHRNSWMTELEIEELERKVTESESVIVAEARSVEALSDHAEEGVRNVLPKMGAEEEADSLDEEEIAIVVETAEVIERGKKHKLPALRNVPKKKLLEETAKIDKVLNKFLGKHIEFADHKKDKKWLQDLRSEVNVKKKNKIDITTGSLKKILGSMPNWKSRGPEFLQGFGLKNFSSLHERVRLQLKECLDSGSVPSWLTRGRTLLFEKDKIKGNVASNYRLITCLSLMGKLLTGIIADQIYAHLDQGRFLPEEQKGCRKCSRGTNNLLYIDRAVIKEVKSRNKNLAMAWIDYKKAYDIVPHSWIIECLDLFGVAENIKRLLVNSMKKWKVMLCSGNSELGEVEIKRGIFHGDSLSPLLFVLALIQLS